jgi:hypothetical protein
MSLLLHATNQNGKGEKRPVIRSGETEENNIKLMIAGVQTEIRTGSVGNVSQTRKGHN